MYPFQSNKAGWRAVPTHSETDEVIPVRFSKRRKWVMGWGVFSLVVASLIGISYLTRSSKASRLSIPGLLSQLQVPRSEVVFMPMDRFTSLTEGFEVIDPWRAIIPPGNGFVTLKSDLDSGKLDHGSEPPDHYCISMYHQLHCLENMKMAIFPDGNLNSSHHNHNDRHHLEHCIQYLVQAVMCAGDMSLEKATVTRSGGVTNVVSDGWDTKHTCRDWDTLWDFTAGLAIPL